MKGLTITALAGVISVACIGCDAAGGSGEGAEGRTERVTVFAASSLTDVFRELETRFEEVHPSADVVLVFAGSQLLRIQIGEGAPADVFASANPQHVQLLADAGLTSTGQPFATNELVVVVPLENPAGIYRFEDLPRARRIVLGSANVPAGRYARDVLRAADAQLGPDFMASVLANVVSEETNVRLARSRVETGEADAAIVYRTDALRSSRLRIIPIPPSITVRAEYQAARVERPGTSPFAASWIDFLTTEDARALLAAHGFGRPGES